MNKYELTDEEFSIIQKHRAYRARERASMELQHRILNITARYTAWRDLEFHVSGSQIVSLEAVVFTWLRLHHDESDPYERALYVLGRRWNEADRHDKVVPSHEPRLFSQLCNTINAVIDATRIYVGNDDMVLDWVPGEMEIDNDLE